jgi:hypothetical protein
MIRKRIKFSPKLQSSNLDDIKKFVRKDALNTPVISSYNNLPTSYQNGEKTDPKARKTSEYMDDLSRMDQDSIINSRFPGDTDVAIRRLEEMYPHLLSKNKNYSKEQSQAAMQASRLYLSAPMTDQRRIEREENTVAAKPLTTFELMERDNVGYFKQPTKMDETGLRPVQPAPSGGQFYYRGGGKVESYQNENLPKYQMAGKTDPNFRDTDFFTDEEKRDMILNGQRPPFNPGPIDFNAKPSGSFTKEDWDRMHEDKRSRVEKILGTETYNKLKDRPEFKGENVAEFFDSFGSSSWNDALQSHDQWHKSGRTYPTLNEGVEMFGAIPGLGKLGRFSYLDPNSMKRSFKTIPWQKIINKADAVKDEITKDLPSIESIQPTKPGTFSGVPLYQNGGKKQNSDYDIDRALELGYGRDKSGHMYSRDYETGRILKSKNHETYQQALDDDRKIGYYPVEHNGQTYTVPSIGSPRKGPFSAEENAKRPHGRMQELPELQNGGQATKLDSLNLLQNNKVLDQLIKKGGFKLEDQGFNDSDRTGEDPYGEEALSGRDPGKKGLIDALRYEKRR